MTSIMPVPVLLPACRSLALLEEFVVFGTAVSVDLWFCSGVSIQGISNKMRSLQVYGLGQPSRLTTVPESIPAASNKV